MPPTDHRRSPPPTAPPTYSQGAVRPLTILEGPDAWTAADYPGDVAQYAYVLTDDDVAELEAAVAAVAAAGLDIKV